VKYEYAPLSSTVHGNQGTEAINHFDYNFAKYLPILKILSPANTTIGL